MPRCCIVTAHRGKDFAEIAKLTLPRMEKFANIHGHDLRVHRMDDTDLTGAWMKVPTIIDCLQADFDFVFWVDIDALIVRLDRDIIDAARAGADLFISWHDVHTARLDGPDFPPHYNAGVYLIRRSDWSKNFFERMMTLYGKIKHGWTDQAALHVMLGLNEPLGFGPDLDDVADRSHIGRLDPAWNSIPGVAMAEDPIIHHFAGLPHNVRLRLMESNIEMLELYDSKSTTLRSAQSLQLSLWTATERRYLGEMNYSAHEIQRLTRESDELRQDTVKLSEETVRLSHETARLALENKGLTEKLLSPRYMLRNFPKVTVRRLKEKVRGSS